MKFATAISLLTLAKPIRGVAARKRGMKSPKPNRSGGSGLEDFSYDAHDFAGSYSPCFQSVTRNSKSGFATGTFHQCGEIVFDFTIKSNDDYGAYEGVVEVIPGAEPVSAYFQGYARDNMIYMTSFGDYMEAFNFNPEQEGGQRVDNDTPDEKVCEMFNNNVLSCYSHFTEYCDEDDDYEACKDRNGLWLNTYSTWTVYAQDPDHCPPAPEGFCESNLLPLFGRRLGDEEEAEGDEKEDEEKHVSCPFLQ
jgi:hypothetical protein